jgi:hypothetical protein
MSAPPALYWLCTRNHGIQFPFLSWFFISVLAWWTGSHRSYVTQRTSLYQSGSLHIIILWAWQPDYTRSSHSMVCLWENVHEDNGTFFNKMLKSEVLKAWRQSSILWDETRCRLYQQTFALTSPSSSGCSVGIIRSRTQVTEFSSVAY